ncbi:MAG: Coenzyme F420 hydrogenase/dehydrogenase, beta subunit C-terminal domain [Thermosediminibacteraceae bacterium]|nr:Coenzyme F420 hydrogenase/dehydrogenase, beta subunit C-terminal domain [Thermosediminibacteraceae bacterium]
MVPKIDCAKCSSCGLCVDVCPVKNNDSVEDITDKDVYALWSKTENLRLLSTSGGVASSISFKLLMENYATVGAVYSRDYTRVFHEYCDTIYKIFDTIGSKYVQSNFSIGFKKALSDKNNKYVIFGTPCQIIGAKNVLKKLQIDELNYYLIDFFCHGIPSYILWKAFIDDLNSKVGRIYSLNLRFKDTDWHEFKIRAIGKNGVYLKKFSKDPFGKLYLSNYCLRNTCYTCRFNKFSAADIRIGDFWGEFYEENKMGVSIVLPITEKGFDLIIKSKDIEVESVPSNYLFGSQLIKEGKRFPVPPNNDKVLEDLKKGLSLKAIYKIYFFKNDIKRLPLKLVKGLLPKKYIKFVKKAIRWIRK